jgi:hypothetical protein
MVGGGQRMPPSPHAKRRFHPRWRRKRRSDLPRCSREGGLGVIRTVGRLGRDPQVVVAAAGGGGAVVVVAAAAVVVGVDAAIARVALLLLLLLELGALLGALRHGGEGFRFERGRRGGDGGGERWKGKREEREREEGAWREEVRQIC